MTRERFRAMALAAIMVLSVIAMGAGFAGSAAADSHSVVVGADGDYESIQTAIDDEGANTNIVVEDGEYESFIVDANNVSVRSADGATPTVSGSANVQSYPTTVGVDANRVTISGFNIDADGVGIFVVTGSSGVQISDNSIAVPSGTSGEANGILTQYGGTSDLSIHNNAFTTPHGDAYNHVYVSGGGSSNVTVSENTFEGSVGFAVGVAAENTGVVDNDFSSVTITQERSVAVEVYSDPDPTISGNAGSLVDVVPSAGNSDTNQLYSSIQAGIDSASTGDTVEVGPGTYEENVEIETGIELVGNNAAIAPESGRAINIKSNVNDIQNLTVSGFHLTTGDDSIVLQSNSAENTGYNGQNYTYTDLVIEPNANAGIGLFDVKSATLSNVTVTGSTIEGAGAVEMIGVNDIDIIQSNISDNTNGIRVLSVDGYEANEDVNIENSTISGNANYGVKNADGSITIDARSNWWGSESGPDDGAVSGNVDVNPWLDAPIDDGGDEVVAATVGDEQFSTVQSAVTAAEDGDSVLVKSGTYDENVTVDTPNVSIVGQGDDTVINGLVYLNEENVTLGDVAVEPDQFVRPSGDDGLPNDEKQAILITASNVSVYDSTVDVSLDANGNFEEVNAIQVFGGDPVTDVQIVNNDITGTASNDEVAGVVGVSDQAETEGTLVLNNSISVDSEGYSFGVVTRASGGSNVEETPETVVVYNDIDATADAYPGVGYGIESTDEAQVDADAQVVKDNTFGDVDSIQLKAAEGTLDVTMNEWEDLENVSFKTDGFGSSVQNGGEIVYDPFLTSSPNANDFTRPGERTDFGHDLVVPADGEPHSVAFPTAVEGNVSEVFGEFDGTVYAYDGDEWKSGEAVRDEDIDALDAFAVTVDEGEQDLRIDFEYAESDDPVPSMTTADLEEGWNFVGAPSGNVDSDEAFAGSTADVTTVIDAIAGPNSETTPYGLDASREVSNPGEVSPFKGYWVFVTDDGELGATVPVDPTQETEEGALTGN